MIVPLRKLLYIALLAALVAITQRAAADEATVPKGQIAFTSRRDGHFQIYIVDADGSNLTNISRNMAEDQGPAWSPDGKQIAFYSYGQNGGFTRIFVMESDGSNRRGLTPDNTSSYEPTWSPDGKQIAFRSGRFAEYLYIMNADGSNAHRLTNDVADVRNPAWSPDGKRIAFDAHSTRNNNQNIYLINVDGSKLGNWTNNNAQYTNPAWSPDGKYLAFQVGYEIYRMDVTNLHQRRLTNTSVDILNTEPSWSPDGIFIVFASTHNPTDRYTLYIMNNDGSNAQRLLDDAGPNFAPTWRPDIQPMP